MPSGITEETAEPGQEGRGEEKVRTAASQWYYSRETSRSYTNSLIKCQQIYPGEQHYTTQGYLQEWLKYTTLAPVQLHHAA